MADISLADSRHAALEQAAEILAAITSMSFRSSMAAMGVPEELHAPLSEFNRRYDYSQHITGTNGELLSELGLLEFVGDRYIFAGNSEQVVDQLTQAASYGVDQIYIPNMNSEPFAFLRTFTSEILPKMQDIGFNG